MSPSANHPFRLALRTRLCFAIHLLARNVRFRAYFAAVGSVNTILPAHILPRMGGNSGGYMTGGAFKLVAIINVCDVYNPGITRLGFYPGSKSPSDKRPSKPIMSQNIVPNIIIFGETGVGKSSVINQVLGTNEAMTSPGADGCTFSSICYCAQIDGRSFNIYDTAGLNEGDSGTVNSAKAVANLYNLVYSLTSSGGVHLLAFVMKCGRLTHKAQQNYNLFFKAFCDSQVPIVIIVTGCENVEPSMDSWWVKNKRSFTAAKMQFSGHACICTSKGRNLGAEKGCANDEPFKESMGKVKQVFREHCLQIGWGKPQLGWFQRILHYFLESLNKIGISVIHQAFFNRLLGSFSLEAANQVIAEIKHTK